MNMKENTGMVGSHPRASRGTRFINWVVDYLLVVFGGFFLILSVSAHPIKHRFHVDIWEDAPGTVILLVWWFLYYFILEMALGRTLGKFITGTKVVTREGEKPSAGTIALRTLSRFVPFEALSGFWISDTKGCWHDDWTDTVVVKTP
ncbi:MAG: RDD family protein [Acidobacteriia bacterium]|nr:RDD family protein [Terriglobia bacterium]